MYGLQPVWLKELIQKEDARVWRSKMTQFAEEREVYRARIKAEHTEDHGDETLCCNQQKEDDN